MSATLIYLTSKDGGWLAVEVHANTVVSPAVIYLHHSCICSGDAEPLSTHPHQPEWVSVCDIQYSVGYRVKQTSTVLRLFLCHLFRCNVSKRFACVWERFFVFGFLSKETWWMWKTHHFCYFSSVTGLLFLCVCVYILIFLHMFIYRKELTHFIKISCNFEAACLNCTVRCTEPELRLTPGYEGNKEAGQVSHFRRILGPPLEHSEFLTRAW